MSNIAALLAGLLVLCAVAVVTVVILLTLAVAVLVDDLYCLIKRKLRGNDARRR